MDRKSRSPDVEMEEEAPRGYTPEQRLLSHILRRTVMDFVYYRSAQDEERRFLAEDAAGWLFWDGTEPMTFRAICDELGLNYAHVRSLILRLSVDDVDRLSSLRLGE
jgi:hypothetical protein